MNKGKRYPAEHIIKVPKEVDARASIALAARPPRVTDQTKICSRKK
jgi:hypothetical protein